MKKPIKYLIAVLICCISTALLVFGVYSARQISYSLSGTINYEVNTLYTDVTTSLYALNLPFEQSEVSANSKMYQLQNSLSESKPLPQDVVKIGDLNNYSTMGNGVSTENTLTASENFSINYGDYIQDSQVPTSPAFYLVFEVKNYSSATISALLDLTNLIENTTNTLTNPTITKANIYGKTTGQEYSTYYFVVELSFDKHSILKTSNFDNITFTVNAGELVATPQSQFTFSTSGDTATLTKYNGTDTDVVIPSHLEDGKTVTTIGYNAFKDNTTIKSVYIPDTVTTISSSYSLSVGAFNNCTNLTIVDIKGSSLSSIGGYAFYECSSLKSINMPESVESIGDYAFRNCSSLTSINMPESVVSIGGSAFYDCSNLKEVNYLGSVNDWLKISFGNEYSNPLSYGESLYINRKVITEITEEDFKNIDGTYITKINDYAFYKCSSLTSINIPESVESIGRYAFYNCIRLTSITIPKSVESIGSYAFYSCNNLKEVTLPTNDSFKTINDYIFRDCSSLTSITIPDSVTSIGSSAFYGCSNLKEVNYLGSVNDWLKISFGNEYSNPLSYGESLYINRKVITEITEEDFKNIDGTYITKINDYAFYKCSSLTSINIPESVESIGSYAFCRCSSLTSITILESVESIGSFAFRDCSSLTSITIPNSVTSIGSYAFYSCNNLKEVTLPTNDSFKTINDYTFRDCISLTSITIPSNVTSIGGSAFSGCTNLKLVFNLSNIDIVAGSSSNGYVGNYAKQVINAMPNLDNFYEDETGEHYKTDDGTIITLGYILTIPDGTIDITSSLVTSLLPEGASRSDITKVIIPSSVTNMGSSAFSSCSNLKEVNYLGSVNDWLKISFGIYYLSNPLNEGADLYINGNLLTKITEDDFAGLTAINSYAFRGCESLLSVTVPNTVTSIGSYAFCDCSNLKEVTLPTNDSFKTINDDTFYGCSSLTSITIPDSVTSIGSSAFYSCTNLKEVNFIGSVNDWLKISFSNEYSNPLRSGADLYINGELLTEITENDFVDSAGNKITKINSYAFMGCESLLSITMPNTIESIGSYAFYYCTSLTGITIPNSVTSIGYAFSGCINLKEVNYLGSVNDWLKISFDNKYSNPLNEGADLYINGELLTIVTEDDFVGLTEVKSYAFMGCESLLSVTIPKTIESIGSYAFYNCTSLTNITMSNSVTSIGYAFSGCINLKEVNYLGSVNDWLKISFGDEYSNPLYNGSDLYINGYLLTEVKEDDFVGLTAINSYVFYGCESLLSVAIPNTIESIGSYAFRGCSNLREVTLPTNDSFKTINSYTFYGCSSLTTITIPSNVTSIGSDAFSGCNALYRVVVENETVLKGLTGTSSSVMGGLLSRIDDKLDRIYVLETMEASVQNYITSNWTRLELTETVDGKVYIIFRHA